MAGLGHMVVVLPAPAATTTMTLLSMQIHALTWSGGRGVFSTFSTKACWAIGRPTIATSLCFLISAVITSTAITFPTVLARGGPLMVGVVDDAANHQCRSLGPSGGCRTDLRSACQEDWASAKAGSSTFWPRDTTTGCFASALLLPPSLEITNNAIPMTMSHSLWSYNRCKGQPTGTRVGRGERGTAGPDARQRPQIGARQPASRASRSVQNQRSPLSSETLVLAYQGDQGAW